MGIWEHMKIFYLVVEYQSFKGAAHKLQINNSTVSRKIQELEMALGNKLFIRKNPMVLSLIGIKLKNYVEHSCLGILQLETEVGRAIEAKDNVKFYVNDLYFFNLMETIYDCRSIKHILDISNVSIVDKKFIHGLIEQKKEDFLYISSNEEFINTIKLNPQYICWPIHSFPIFWYKQTTNDNHRFIAYNGMETWLSHLHQKHIKKYKLEPNCIVESNSIAIISHLMRCGGSTILPTILPEGNHKLQKSQLAMQKLFVICHVSDVFLSLIF